MNEDQIPYQYPLFPEDDGYDLPQNPFAPTIKNTP